MNNKNNRYQASKIITVQNDQAGQRIDNYLFNLLKTIPKTRIYKMIRKGEVRVNKGRIKQVYRIQADDKIRIPPVQLSDDNPTVSPALNKIKDLEKSIIYESDRLLILNKPDGMAVHGGSGDSYGVIEALRSLRPDAPYLELVHRLDKLTSGCLMIAKRRSCLRYLHAQLRERQIQKTYHCWVKGDWPEQSISIKDPIKTVRFSSGDRRSIIDPEGKPSRTDYVRLKQQNGYSLLRAVPHTGRMHQIRVHCAEHGFPICGDEKYGAPADAMSTYDRLYLHARELTFTESINSEAQTVSCESDSFLAFLPE